MLELACGPGMWTPQLLGHATTVTAVDASQEMLALARERVTPDLERVRLVEADLFCWRPDRRYDVVFISFGIGHVPRERFTEFWSGVEQGLPRGRTMYRGRYVPHCRDAEHEDVGMSRLSRRCEPTEPRRRRSGIGALVRGRSNSPRPRRRAPSQGTGAPRLSQLRI